MNFLKGIIFLATSFLLFQCNKSAGADEIVHHPSISKEKIQPVKKDSPIEKEITYFPLVLKNKESAFAAFDKKYSKEEIHTILALNRLDFKNRWRADTLVIPNVLEEDFNVYSPFPKNVSSAKNINKLAMFSYPIYAYALYEKGKLVKWGPTSMGKKKTPTKMGLGFTNWKKKLAISTSNSEWKLRWNVNIFNFQGIGWHQYDLPGYHASHSCIRLLEEDAFWMYSWAEQWVLDEKGTRILAKGTPVIIFGEPDFKSKPWKELLKSPKANDYSEAQINNEIKPFLEEIIKQQDIRKEYLQSKRDSL
jgi:lipoprotein-anchoring transpeptidase ErfK/SrfK